MKKFHVVIDETNATNLLDLGNIIAEKTVSLYMEDNSSYSTRPKHWTLFGDPVQGAAQLPLASMFDQKVTFRTGLDLDGITILIRAGCPYYALKEIIRGGLQRNFLVPFFYSRRRKRIGPQVHGASEREVDCLHDDNAHMYEEKVPADSLSNPVSAQLSLGICENLIGFEMVNGVKLSPTDMLVIVPYKAQLGQYSIELLKEENKGLHGIRCCTPDMIGSGERAVVVVDTVSKNGLGILNGYQRDWPSLQNRSSLLVAITRSTAANFIIIATDDSQLDGSVPIHWMINENKASKLPDVHHIHYEKPFTVVRNNGD
ncbi:unnamed protein product [Bursaphelenchus xylophilus]|uniref:(pine wood nematode) hypothetical protein n=1 Tax=Bursaphelenchus xylophilus TaxID=6326 RepID=A0A7I8XLU9_BURXY|nr:unnamed protein product [Bursaphelenchus xylophilus]CAG9090187.1 unnamed protein product [Bursaphelenchus xylophilus]